MSSLESQEDLVKTSLSAFIDKHIGGSPPSCNDDIVLSYVTSVLEDLGLQANCGEHFDVDEFIEIMGAYFPGFTNVESSEICEWLLRLTKQLSSEKRSAILPRVNPCPSTPAFIPEMPLWPRSYSSACSSSRISSQPFILKDNSDFTERPCPIQSRKKLPTISRRQRRSPSNERGMEPSDGGDEDVEDDEIDKQIELLREMFPNIRLLEVTQCLSIAGGDAEKAAQLVMHRLENTESFSLVPLRSVKLRSRHKDDKELKEHILSKYAYVDRAEDVKEHKPITPKTEPKKLIRYRDNKIVSLKGEKYTEVKKDDEDDGVKKAVTAQYLKPARQYRFH